MSGKSLIELFLMGLIFCGVVILIIIQISKLI